MDNQHKLINGYRDLSPEEVALMNEIKAHAEQIRALIGRVSDFVNQRDAEETKERDAAIAEGRDFDAPPTTVTSPHRWISIGQTELQQGFMAIVRAVARPTTF